MSRTMANSRIPKLCRHKSREQGYVTLGDREHYLGHWPARSGRKPPPDVRARYDELIAGWLNMRTRSDRNGSLSNHHREERTQPAALAAPPVMPTATPAPPSSRHLESLERKLQLVRTFTRAVAEHLMTGFFLWGSGGVGKTYTVTQQLAALEANYKAWNSRVTGWGLINNLEKYPSHVHPIEDAESMYRDPRAIGVLRSALDGHRQESGGPIERWVTWCGDSAAKTPKEVFFSGGIIILSNSELPSHKPEVAALKTRLKTLQLAVTDEELRALMRSVSAKGFSVNGHAMTPEQCGEVCAFVEEELHAMRSPLNMRVLVDGGFPAYVQHATGDTGSTGRTWSGR